MEIIIQKLINMTPHFLGGDMRTLLFEVLVRNRVVKGSRRKRRIQGIQGSWYEESLYYLAESEEEAERFVIEDVSKRIVLGISHRRFNSSNIKREIEIVDIRRL